MTTRLTRHLSLLLMSSLTSSALAGQPPREGKSHYAKAIAAYKSEDWPTAISELKLAYQKEKRPEYLFALAQSQRLSGDCESAIASYQAFLRVASTRQADVVEGLIKGCAAALARAADDAKDSTETAVDEPRPTSDEGASVDADLAAAAAEVRARPSTVVLRASRGATRWYQDPLGDALALTAVAAAGVGATFLVLGNGAMNHAPATATYGDYLSARSGARTQQLVGLGVIAAGVLCGAAATLRFATLAPLVAVDPRTSGASLVVSGSF